MTQDYDKARELLLSGTRDVMKVTGLTIWQMASVDSFIQAVSFMRATSPMIRLTGKENSVTMMGLSLRASSLTIRFTEKEANHTKMELNSEVNSVMARR